MRSLAARAAALIRTEAASLTTAPIDMRAGTETALTRVVKVFGSARPHHACLFANRMRPAIEGRPVVLHSSASPAGQFTEIEEPVDPAQQVVAAQTMRRTVSIPNSCLSQ